MTSLYLLKIAPMLVSLIIPCIIAYELDSLSGKPFSNSLDQQNIPKLPNDKYFRHIQSIIDAYNGDLNGKVRVETNALIDTKYQTLKRNGDFINSLLGLPKGLYDAGR